MGHREYVGGLWDEVGELQFNFLLDHGLRPDDVLLDIACGSLRGGVRFIEFLDAGNYLGIDKAPELIDQGIEQELGRKAYDQKQPKFVVSDSFEFERFSKTPTVSLAQSLFTHLTSSDVDLCLRNLRAVVTPGHRFFATFFNGSSAENPPNPTPDMSSVSPPMSLAKSPVRIHGMVTT